MADVPEDILRRAIEYAPKHEAKFIDDRPPLRQGFIDGAIAERERCAQIAETVALDTFATHGHMEQRDRHRATIAAAIRANAQTKG